MSSILNRLGSWSLATLIAANLIPLIGVLFYAWDEAIVLALFWIENLIIGAFNLLKILAIVIRQRRFREIFLAVFFVFHYGMFCSVHGMILWDLLDLGELNKSMYFSSNDLGPLDVFAEGFSVLAGFLDRFGSIIMLGIAALVLSHLVRFIENFVLAGEIFRETANGLMARPYVQIMIMHVGLIVGAILIDTFGSTIWLLALIVVFKLIVDVKQYQRRRTAR